MEKCTKLDFTGQSIYVDWDVHKKELGGEYFFGTMRAQEVYPGSGNGQNWSHYLKRNFPGRPIRRSMKPVSAGFGPTISCRNEECVVSWSIRPMCRPRIKERTTKRDRVDCRKLARSLRNGELKGIYVPARSQLEDRSLVRTRQALVRKQTRCKNQIKAFLLFYGLELPEEVVESRWSKKFLQQLTGLQMERASGQLALQSYLEELEQLRKLIAAINRGIILLFPGSGVSGNASTD